MWRRVIDCHRYTGDRQAYLTVSLKHIGIRPKPLKMDDIGGQPGKEQDDADKLN